MYASENSPFSSSSSPLDLDNEFASRSQLSLNNFGHSLNSQMRFPQQYSNSETPPAGLVYERSRTQDRFQSSTLLNSHPPLMEKSPTSAPSLGELLSFPPVQELYNDLADANRRVARALDAQASLQQEILRLSSMLGARQMDHQ